MVLISIVVDSMKNGISPMPISIQGRNKILSMIPKDFQGTIIDLGSGFGSLIFPVAKKFPKATVIGVETAAVPYICSLVWKWMWRVRNSKIEYANLYTKSLQNADFVFCYLYPKAMERLSSVIAQENLTLISYAFALPNYQPMSTVVIGSVYPTNIYVYRILEKSSSLEKSEKTF